MSQAQQDWYFIRHGELELPPGTIPPPLAQLRPISWSRLAEIRRSLLVAIPDIDQAVWVCSTLPRSWESGLLLGAVTPRQSSGFNEQDFGDWHGFSHRELARRDPKGAKQFWSDPIHQAPPHGETFCHMVNRVKSQIYIFKKQFFSYKSIIVICHSGTIRAAHGLSHNLVMDDYLTIEPNRFHHWSITALKF
ncbi:MAG: histidine phosphatase family protein [Alphaproteobacteria bacterium]|nr:histidine phosphatase family protein [Alphaproteobacteria bacterium]